MTVEPIYKNNKKDILMLYEKVTCMKYRKNEKWLIVSSENKN